MEQGYPFKVAVKIHRKPWAFDSENQEIIERAMSNVHVGPKILKYFEGGKIEEYLGEKRHFEWFENEGCIDCRDEAVLKQTACLLARMHYAPHSQVWILILKSMAISYGPYNMAHIGTLLNPNLKTH